MNHEILFDRRSHQSSRRGRLAPPTGGIFDFVVGDWTAACFLNDNGRRIGSPTRSDAANGVAEYIELGRSSIRRGQRNARDGRPENASASSFGTRPRTAKGHHRGRRVLPLNGFQAQAFRTPNPYYTATRGDWRCRSGPCRSGNCDGGKCDAANVAVFGAGRDGCG